MKRNDAANSTYVVTASEMREMDHQTIASFGLPGRILMENAGRGAVRVLLDRFSPDERSRIGILAGKGNNGGDGFVIARYLAQMGTDVIVYLLGSAGDIQGEDAAANHALLPLLRIPVAEITDDSELDAQQESMEQRTLWVDAVFGTGLSSDVRGIYREAIDRLNRMACPVLAVDIPSGLHSDTGQPCGLSVQAHTTVTFGFPKPGHLQYPGTELTGHLEVIDIGIPPYIADRVGPTQFRLCLESVKQRWRSRAADAHKGTAGHLLVIAGSAGKTGAAAMTSMSAMRAGAGLVTLGAPESVHGILENQVLEAMTFPLPETAAGGLGESAYETVTELLTDKNCLAIGPGLGVSPETTELVSRLVSQSPVPLVIDADGLNCLASRPEILRTGKSPIILTPHPGEMARLNGSTTGEIQRDRIAAARSFAVDNAVHLVLKGAGTLIAHPDGRAFINTTGNSGMASGGMGDVLTGLIAGLVTQGYEPEDAAHIGVFLHGTAADTLAQLRGPVGYLAGDVMNRIPEEIGNLTGQ